MNLKNYYGYKRKFLLKSNLERKEKSYGGLYINLKSNNLFVCIVNNKGEIDYIKSSGCFGYKTSRNRLSKVAVVSIFKSVIKKLIDLKWNIINIIYTGIKFKKKNFYIFDYLDQRKIKVNLIVYAQKLRVFNGCRRKKEPRK